MDFRHSKDPNIWELSCSFSPFLILSQRPWRHRLETSSHFYIILSGLFLSQMADRRFNFNSSDCSDMHDHAQVKFILHNNCFQMYSSRSDVLRNLYIMPFVYSQQPDRGMLLPELLFHSKSKGDLRVVIFCNFRCDEVLKQERRSC